MEISKPSTSSRRDFTTAGNVNDSHSDEFRINENESNEESTIYVPYSMSNEEDEILVLEQAPDGMHNRKRGATQKVVSDVELGWKRNTCSVSIPAFSGNQGLSPNSAIIEESSPMDSFRLFFDNDILTGIQNETNRYAK
jgi:hypothetical protein